MKELIKYVATINDEVLSETTEPETEIKYVDIGNVDSTGKINGFTVYQFKDAPSRARRIVRDGDVIVSTVRTYLQAIAAIESPPEDLVVSTGFAVVRPRKNLLDVRFCKYALREPEFLHEVQARSVGVSYPAINASELGNISISVPSLTEQELLAQYLDLQTAKIDTLIAVKQKLLTLLAEKRSALITHAVTRGLNPDTPLCDAGIEFVETIPQSWKVINLKFLGDVRTGVAKGRDLGKQVKVNVPYLRVANVQDGYLDLSDISEIEVLPEEISSFTLEKGDVLMNEGGDADKLGRGAVWDGSISPCLHQNHVFAVRCRNIEPEWLTTVTRSNYAKAYFESRSKQSTNLASISATNIREFPVIVPPESERRKIIDHVQHGLERLDKLFHSTEALIGLLYERRAALISETVLGKVDIFD